MASDEATPEAKEEDVFDLGQDAPTEEPFEYEEDELNLVAAFKKHQEGRAALKRLAEKCLTDFDNAWSATDDFRVQMGKTWNLFVGHLEKRDAVFKDMAQAHVPILMENTVRMHYRQQYELFGNWTNVFGVTPIGPDDENTAKLLSLHGNWQIRRRIPDFKREVGDRGLLMFTLFGDVTFHSWWDTERRCNRHQALTANEFVCANAHVSTMHDYSDVPWVARKHSMAAHEVRKKAKLWEDVETTLKRLPPDWEDQDTASPLREAVDRAQGVDQSAYQSGEYVIIQYEGWLNLPGQDRDRYCQVFIDKTTNTVLSLGIHERPDPYDKRRFEFEVQQLQQWQAAVQEAQAFEQEKQQTIMAAMEAANLADPMSDAPAQAVMQARQIEQMPAPQVPPMPDWMGNDPEAQPRPVDTVPIRMFTHVVNIEPLQGILGIGMGRMHADLNKAANIALCQFIDQATYNNLKNWIADAGLKFENEGGKIVLSPGKIHKVTGAMDLAKQMIPMEFGEANPQLLNLVDLFIKFGQTISNTPEVLSGEAGKSGETAQGLSARIEQATKMLSVPTGKYADGLSHVLQNNAALNAIFLDDAEFFTVNNHDPALGALGQQQFSVGREMYDRPYDVEISADLKFTSTQQRISEADALVQLPGAGPIAPAMGGNFAFLYETVKKSLEARNRYDLVGLMGAPPQPPQMFGMPSSPPAPPPGMMPPPGSAPPSSPAPGGQAPSGGAQQQPQQGPPQ